MTGAAPTARPLPRPGSGGAWWLAIRPKTLTAALAPVLIGTALAYGDQLFRLGPALAALAGALAIQIGTNLANDVMDWRKGADTAERLGPTRTVQAGLLPPRAVAWGATASFALAAALGLYLTAVSDWQILVLGIVSIAAGILYTAGPFPLAYIGLGDVFVLAFFGIAAVAGTYFVQAVHWSPVAMALGVAVGCLGVAILVVNNLRDIDTDRAAGKRTLVVRMGADWARRYYATLVALAFLIPLLLLVARWVGPFTALVLAALPSALPPVRAVLAGTSGRALNPLLGLTASLQLVYALLLSAGLVLQGRLGG
jgi:1,4-dihydroxy-2-naphthoate octaprenyltransferase